MPKNEFSDDYPLISAWIPVICHYPPINKNVLITDGETVGTGVLLQERKMQFWKTDYWIDGAITFWAEFPKPPEPPQ